MKTKPEILRATRGFTPDQCVEALVGQQLWDNAEALRLLLTVKRRN